MQACDKTIGTTSSRNEKAASQVLEGINNLATGWEKPTLPQAVSVGSSQ